MALSKMVENGGNASQAMKDAGYSQAMAKNPQKLTRSKAVKNALAPLLKKHNLTLDSYLTVIAEAQRATKVVTSHTEPDYTVPDHGIRLSANKQLREFLLVDKDPPATPPITSKELKDAIESGDILTIQQLVLEKS